MIEIKYSTRSKFSETVLQKYISDAKKQLDQYGQDSRISRKCENLQLIKIILVFNGWELVYSEAVN